MMDWGSAEDDVLRTAQLRGRQQPPLAVTQYIIELKCPSCGGSGQAITLDTLALPMSLSVDKDDCPNCDGTGWVPVSNLRIRVLQD